MKICENFVRLSERNDIMQIDKNLLDQLISLDDQTLSRTISLLANAAGIDQSSANAAISDLRSVRSSLGNATNADISRAVSMLGEERVNALLTILGRKNG